MCPQTEKDIYTNQPVQTIWFQAEKKQGPPLVL